jgi:hydroxymethylpyrimidine pyrophosphatase-like HAD family hydrolase
MPYLALATDYDGTIARDGRVEGSTLAALALLRDAGWRLILATGRELEDLRGLMPGLELFDRVVAENGGVLHTPATGHVRPLAGPASPALLAMLASRGVQPLQHGHIIVETWQAHEESVRAAIRDLGLDLAMITNKGALMIMPAGVSKAGGTREALRELGIPPASCVGVGDAENDLDLLALCGLSVAVGNALPAVKQVASLVLASEGAEGVTELARWLLQPAPAPAAALTLTDQGMDDPCPGDDRAEATIGAGHQSEGDQRGGEDLARP